jgi:hypothetical protein
MKDGNFFSKVIVLMGVMAISACSTTGSNQQPGLLSVINPENTCRNYHSLFTNKSQTYRCKMVYEDGSVYVGDFMDKEAHGNGEMKWPSGATFSGVWFRNQMENGVYTFPSGQKVQGFFRDSRLHGQGKIIAPDGRVLVEGLFESGTHVPESEINRRRLAAEAAERDRQAQQAARQREEEIARENQARERARREQLEREARENELRERARREQLERERIAREGDGSAHDLLCKRYGLRPSTPQYTDCRIQLDAHERQRAEEQRIYDQRLAEYERERERRRGEAMFLLGMGMLANSSRPAARPMMPMPEPPAMQNFNLFIKGMPPINCRSNLNIVDCR